MKKNRDRKSTGQLYIVVSAIVTLLSMFSPSAFGDFDLSLGGFARSFPLSGYLDVQAGYGQIVWGSEGGVLYGYARPYVELDTAGTFNSAMAAFEFFPISFLGVRAGKEWLQNDSKYKDFDCSLYNCEGSSTREFAEAQLLLGYDIWFSSFWLRWERWSLKNESLGEALEPSSGLAITPSGDSELVARGFTGITVDPGWAVIAGAQYYRMVRHFGETRVGLAGVRWSDDELHLNIMLGGTYYQSTEQKGGAGAFIGFTWSALPSVALK